MYFTLHACTHRARRGVPTPHGLQIYSHDPITCTAHWHIHAGKRGAPAPCTHSTEHLCIHIEAPKGRASPPHTKYPAPLYSHRGTKGARQPPANTVPSVLYSHRGTKGAHQPPPRHTVPSTFVFTCEHKGGAPALCGTKGARQPRAGGASTHVD